MGLKTRIVETPCGGTFEEIYWEDDEVVIGESDEPIPVELPVRIHEDA